MSRYESKYDPFVDRYVIQAQSRTVILSNQSSSRIRNRRASSLLYFLSSLFLSPRIPRTKTIQWSVNGQLYFLSFLSTVVLRSPVPEERRKKSEGSGYAVKKKEENDRRGWGQEGKESGQCSRKLASKSCGRNERRTPPSAPRVATSTHYHLLTILSFRSGESLRWREWETAAVGNGAARWGGGGRMEGHCRRREAYGPPYENPRGNFAERTSISCIQWDIGIKRISKGGEGKE